MTLVYILARPLECSQSLWPWPIFHSPLGMLHCLTFWYNHHESRSEYLPWSFLGQVLKVLWYSGERYRAIVALLFIDTQYMRQNMVAQLLLVVKCMLSVIVFFYSSSWFYGRLWSVIVTFPDFLYYMYFENVPYDICGQIFREVQTFLHFVKVWKKFPKT